MNVVIVLTGIGVLPERRNNVSGHVQIPLKTAALLSEQGHAVTLVGTTQSDGTALPGYLPSSVRLKVVADGRRRGQLGKQNSRSGYRPTLLVRQVFQTLKIIRRAKADIVHVFGFERMVRFGALLKLFSGKSVVVTVLGQRPRPWFGFAYRYVDEMLALTESVAAEWAECGRQSVEVLRPGVVRDMSQYEGGKIGTKKFRVLFWREASRFGGADLCLKAFCELAPRYPNIEFCFAVRHNRDEVSGLAEATKAIANITLYRFPYPEKISLERLIEESLFVVLPFRELSIEPQMTVLETLSTGCPVLCTNLRSLPELVIEGDTGWLVPPGDVVALTARLDAILSDQSGIASLRQGLAGRFAKRWGWQSHVDALKDTYGRAVVSS